MLCFRQNRWQDALVHARPCSAVTADDCNAALNLKPIAAVNQLHLGTIGFVAIWSPDFASAVFVISFGCHIPNDVFANVSGVSGAAIPFKAGDQFTTNGVAALFHLNMTGFPLSSGMVFHVPKTGSATAGTAKIAPNTAATKVFFISTYHVLRTDCGEVDILASLTLGHVAFFTASCHKAATHEMR
jgi:hypothetical protein